MELQPSDILVFKTNLATKECIEQVRPVLNQLPYIKQWNVDEHDVDAVLRIVPLQKVAPVEIIRVVEEAGFLCEELPD